MLFRVANSPSTNFIAGDRYKVVGDESKVLYDEDYNCKHVNTNDGINAVKDGEEDGAES